MIAARTDEAHASSYSNYRFQVFSFISGEVPNSSMVLTNYSDNIHKLRPSLKIPIPSIPTSSLDWLRVSTDLNGIKILFC